MQLKTLIAVIVTGLMLSSGLVILADNVTNANENGPAVALLDPAVLYNLTFVAQGLTNLFNGSSSWHIVLYNNGGGFPLYPTSNTVSKMVSAGTYYYQANDYFQDLYGDGYSPSVTVDSNTTVYLKFSQPQSIIFNETGLSSIYHWGVDMSGTSPVYTPSSMVSGESSVIYYAVSGQYSYSWFENQAGFNTTVGSSNFLDGHSNLTFSLPISSFSNVTFSENNLPSGTTWFIRQVSGPDANGSYNESSGSTMVMRAMNGVNTFVAGYLMNGFSVNLTYISVDFGVQSAVNVDFPQLYSVTISATNFPDSADFNGWGINASFYYGSFINSFQETGSASQALSVLLPAVTVMADPFIEMNSSSSGSSSYVAQLPQYYFQVNQSGLLQPIHLGTLYSITISFAGMPASGYLALRSESGNITSFTSSQRINSMTLLAPNGTYSFDYGVGTTPQIASSVMFPFSFSVSGSGVTVNLELYNVTFSSDYAQNGFSLYMENPVTSYYNFHGQTSSGQSLYMYLLNGTYSYYEHSSYNNTLNSLPVEASGQLTVSGHSESVLGKIPTTYFNTTISAAGLPPGNQYYLLLTLISGSLYGNSNLYFTSGIPGYIWLPGGEYFANFITSYVNGVNYFANNTYFNVSSTGSVQFIFSTNAYVKFVEQGLPAGTAWSLTYGGISYRTAGSDIVVKGNASQNVQFTIDQSGNFIPDPSSGSIVAANQDYYNNNGTVNFVIPVQFNPETLLGKPGINISTFNISSLSTGQGSQLNFSGSESVDTVTPDPSNGLTYVTYTPNSFNQAVSYVAVVNSSNYDPITTIVLGSGAVPSYSMLDMTNGILYTVMKLDYNPDYYYIASLNTADNNVLLTPVNISGLTSLVVDPQTNMMYAAGYNAIYVLNPTTLNITSTILMNSTYATYQGGQGLNLFYSTETGLIYATGYMPEGIVAINPSDNRISGNYTFNIHANWQNALIGGSTMDQKDSLIYFVLQQYNETTGSSPSNLVSFNLASHVFTVGPLIGQGFAVSIAYDSYNGYIYIPIQNQYDSSSILYPLELGHLDIYEPSNGLLVNYTELGQNPDWISVDPANNNILIGNTYMGSVTIIGTESYGSIQGTVNIPSSSVTIDGLTVPVINGHFAASVQPGTYYVSAFAKGFSPLEQSVRVTDLSTSSIDLNLNATATTYNITGKVSPSDASVLFNGIAASVGTSGNYYIYVTPGKYTVSAYLYGYFPLSERISIGGNTSINLTLSKEPSPKSIINRDNFSVLGFNVTISAVSNNVNSTFTVRFNSSADGILLVEVPFADMNNVNLSDILNSRVYINNVEYSNFSISLSPNYTIILKVSDLSKDPTMLWSYGPEAVPPKIPSSNNVAEYYYVMAALAAIIIVGAVVIVVRGRGMKR